MPKKLWRTEIEIRETNVRKNKSDIRIKFFTIKISKKFPGEAGNGSPSLRMADFKLRHLNILDLFDAV